jgi:DNA-binding NarL/FixJ family response regulator
VPEPLPVRLLATGLLRQALETALAGYPEIRVVEHDARVLILQATEDWSERVSSAIRPVEGVDPQRVVLLTSSRTIEITMAALAGAQVFVHLEDPTEEVVEAIRRASIGAAYTSRSLYPALMQALRELVAGSADSDTMQGGAKLTPREAEVAELAAQRLSHAQIARLLHVSIPTVRTHLQNARRKVRSRNRGAFRGGSPLSAGPYRLDH